jgi:hypothetical protein
MTRQLRALANRPFAGKMVEWNSIFSKGFPKFDS